MLQKHFLICKDAEWRLIMMANPKVSVIIVNYNGIEDTLECLESLKKCEYNNLSIIIVDNASDDVNIKKLNEIEGAFIKVLYNNENLGFSGGNNVGIRVALEEKADLVCLLNNDTIVEADFIPAMVNRLLVSDKVSVVSPMIKDYYSMERISYAGGDINSFKGGVFIEGINSYDEQRMQVARRITFASGCCMLIRAEVFKYIGYLTEDYFLYYEDTDFSKRVINAGYEMFYEPKAVIYHKESVSTELYSDNYQYYFVRNRLKFISENLTLINKLTAYPWTVLYILKKIFEKKFMLKNVQLAIYDFLNHNYGKKKV